MSSCFNFSKCNEENMRIFVYNQTDTQNSLPVSIIYSNILDVLRKQASLTNNPDEACLFVLSIDTLDRDKLSPNFIKDLNSIVKNLTHWNNGENHVIFNMYSGSWPNYIENLEFDTGKAILAKTSLSIKSYRRGFDVSFPLFHVNLPRTNSLVPEQDPNLALFSRKKYFLTFKGKRYLHGIGSETRDSLHHFNNQRDVFLQTTCKHGINWEEIKDERCDLDNELYEKLDYNDMLYNSTFCLVPRGRRLATYRFLESLKAGLSK
jgi:glucuronyl/N-acetylglucosaminyl transferase EXT1